MGEMTHRCPSYVVAILTLTLNHIRTAGGNCYSSYGGIRGKSFECEDGYYCCNIYSGACCPEAGGNEFYDWILVISSIAVLLFVAVMSCYWCSCCPAYKRRTPTETSGVSVIQPAHETTSPAGEHRLYNEGPYVVQSVSNCDDQMPPFPQEPLGVRDQLDQALVAPSYGEAPPYSRHPAPNHRLAVLPPYPTCDSYVSLTLPVYPDEPPPHYSP